MIHGLTGKLKAAGINYVVVEVAGVAYKVFIPLNQEKLPKTGERIELFTHLQSGDSGMNLYGFFTEAELNLFESLVTVSGVGPKSAMAILSVAPVDQIANAIGSGEPDLIQRSAGVGRKTAERIIVELRDKVAGMGGSAAVRRAESDQDVFEALLSLGYSRKQAESVLRELDPKIQDVRERLKEALKLIGE